MSFEKIQFDIVDDIATITLSDDATLNALGLDVVDELMDAFSRAAGSARCTILTGSGRAFSSGANLSSSPEMANPGMADLGGALDSHYHPLINKIRSHPHPVLTAINGAAAGVGCSIALLGDLVIAAESAYFLQAFRRIGLVPDGGSTYLLPRAIGRVRAMEMALLGDKIPAQKALDWGLINRVTTNDGLMAEARLIAERLASGPTQALAMTRRLIWEGEERVFEAQIQSERMSQKAAGHTDDFKEGVTAFHEKRPAVFKGK